MTARVVAVARTVVIVTGADGTQSVVGPFVSPQRASRWATAAGVRDEDGVFAFVTRMISPAEWSEEA